MLFQNKQKTQTRNPCSCCFLDMPPGGEDIGCSLPPRLVARIFVNGLTVYAAWCIPLRQRELCHRPFSVLLTTEVPRHVVCFCVTLSAYTSQRDCNARHNTYGVMHYSTFDLPTFPLCMLCRVYLLCVWRSYFVLAIPCRPRQFTLLLEFLFLARRGREPSRHKKGSSTQLIK